MSVSRGFEHFLRELTSAELTLASKTTSLDPLSQIQHLSDQLRVVPFSNDDFDAFWARPETEIGNLNALDVLLSSSTN